MIECKYPRVRVKLVGEDGNAFAILGRVSRELRRAGHGDKVSEFISEATQGDYDSLLRTCMSWVDCIGGERDDEDDEEEEKDHDAYHYEEDDA